MEDNKIHCSFCRELISEEALICPFCNRKTKKQRKKEAIRDIIKYILILLMLLSIKIFF